MLTRLKAAIFDIDGTLIESMDVDGEIYVSSIRDVLGSVKFRPSFSDYDNVTEVGILQQLVADNSLNVDKAVLGQVRQRFVAGLRDHIKSVGPFPHIHGARRAIDWLNASQGYQVAIATGGWRDAAELKLQSAGFGLEGIPVATCDDSASRTDIMTIALEKLDREFDSITYFGDRDWDAKACRILGWEFVAVGSVLNGIESFDEYEFD